MMTTTLYAVIADIREASGLGVKPMLSELAPEIGKMRAEIDRLQERCEAYKGQVECGAMMIERLREALTDSYEENLYSAIHCGATGNGGKWWPGGMSDAEWFCRQAGMDYSPQFTKEDLLSRVPSIAVDMVTRLIEQIESKDDRAR